ncbi:C40 family peptidase [Nonomuraea gerenzanensis]|uniref:Putative secreted protein n=1 Tax=Nonomuraea gerenzanensis TaxID=93944 RepID=A0A1M4E6Q4_9ACTN|nr:C40 family peptidase [Nonomuraea gerenzanensis]UBU16772.1 C40 family peptidase [Nonomuraea gerenzanensis]SBO94482.1 putative secreted protein [Nonomuraea gerenzanensis]
MTVTAGGLVLHAPTAQAATTSDTAALTTVKAETTAKTSKKATAAQRGAAKLARQQAKARRAVSVAKNQIGDPYRYGGTGPGSFDCSGLVQFAWKKAGVKLPRVASSQFARTRHKVSWRKLRPGDLMFFSGLGHVGMYVGKGKMIHSPRTGERVRIDKLSGWRRSSFVGAVRPGM